MSDRQPNRLPFRAGVGAPNVVALLRWKLFTYRDLWKWIDDPYGRTPQKEAPWQLHLFLDSITQPMTPNRIS